MMYYHGFWRGGKVRGGVLPSAMEDYVNASKATIVKYQKVEGGYKLWLNVKVEGED